MTLLPIIQTGSKSLFEKSFDSVSHQVNGSNVHHYIDPRNLAKTVPVLDLTSVNAIETDKSLDGLGSEGFGRADSVRADELKKSQYATVKVEI